MYLQSSAVDLDSLLQSHGEITSDENSPDRHYRPVDEILLNYSSSPSPPSSPSTSYSAHQHSRSNLKDDDYVSTGVGSSRNQRWSHSPSSTLVESDKYNPAAGPASNSNRTKSMGRVLPQLFGRGAIRSKPGAALAAAAAASRSITTPHATAIKLRRATTGVLQRPVSETTEKIAACDDSSLSPSAVASRVSENGSEDGEVKLEQFLMGNTNADSQKTDAGMGYSAGDGIQENSDEVAEDATNSETLSEAADDNGKPRVDEDDECKMTTSESQKASPIENEKDLALDKVNVNEQVIFPLLDENVEEYPADESGNNDKTLGPTTILTDDDHKEDLTGGEEASDFGNVVAGTGDDDAASTQSVVADMLGDLALTPEKKGHHTNLQQNSHLLLKPLDLAEEIEKKQAFTGLHYEEGAAAQPMRLEGVPRGSTVLGYFDVDPNNAITQTISSQAFRREHGSPQVVAVHLNYIAVGMSRGSIFVQPSKYTAHQVDNMDGKMISLGLQGDRSHVPVTSMCFNQQGDLLFAGYGDGHYTVWDVQKASALKVITEHRAPVVHMLYLGQDTQVTRQFNVVSGDSKGVVKLIRFSVVPWLNRISYSKSMKLLDETTSRVVCASPLLYGEGHAGAMIPSPSSSALTTTSISSMMGAMVDEGVVIFITHQSALVAKVSPAVEVYAHIPRPDSVRDSAMPYATWRCMSQSLGSSSENAPVETSDKVSLLAIAWDREVQVAKLLNSELKVLEKWTLEYAVIGLAWLGDEMLAVLTLTAQLYLFAKDGSLIHQMSCSFDGFRGDDLISYHIYFTNAFGNPEKAYHNSVAVRGATIYILGPEHLVVSRLLSWKERIEVLRKAGDWMGALNMAMTLYDGASPGVIDLPKNLDDIQRIVMPYLVELLQSYVTEVFSYISVACNNQNGELDQSNEIKEQYTRVGGVAIEFCVHIRRTDILFDDIMSNFDDAHHKETFLELLEPYILKDMLGSLPPEIMQALVEHYSKRGWLQRIEQCVLHMDILSLDFNQVVRLCREHRLHCALIYLFNKGLDDFRTPIEELLVVLRNSVGENATCLGYRMLVYLKYCFKGLAFPPGRGNLSPTRLPSLRKELLHFLLEDSSAPNSWAVTRLPPNRAYANLLHLLELDTEATLEVLKCAFTDVELPKSTPPFLEPTSFNMESAESQKLVQKVVDILSDILDATYFQAGSPICSNDLDLVELWPSKKDVGHMFDFIAYYIAYEQAKVPRDILSQILEYLTSEINISDTVSGMTIEIFKRRERQLLSLLKVVPETDWDAPYLLYLCEKAQFHQVCGYIHAIRHQYIAALDSYMKVNHEPIYAFSFIHDMLRLLSNGECDAFESAVISRIPDLFKLSRSIKLLHNNQVNMTDEMTELYFELLCRYDRESVLKFLETSESYRVEHCLHLCQEYGIVDAASFLLERVGDVGSALLLILSNVSDKFVMLDAEIEKTFSDTVVNNLNAVLKIKVVAEILDVVHACIGLCQRNSPRLKPEESEYLWFQLLDSFCEPLMDSGNARTDSESEALQDTLDGSMGELEYKEGFKFKWKVSKFHKGADIMRKLFAIFIKEIVEGMIGYDAAKSLIEDDTYYTMSLLRKGASHGYAPRSLVCCICNSFLTKNSADSSVQLFSCGHAMHLHCELQENGASFRGTVSGCPVCIPRKKAQRSCGRSMLAENGLVSRSSSRTQQARGSPALHPHDHESADNSYSLHPPSRFELLHNLEKDQKLIQIENVAQLRLAPPALYHEKVKKGIVILAGESTSTSTTEKARRRRLGDVKVKGSLPLKSNIFGKGKISRR
ncbi:Vacuolar protein sorting-associated protein 8 [Sesamum alatum]|uniref:Vacuolar protein sorting-associated protein 8 n=1 Tax=Sesamum alatum TaxID=300844 RepID=A0AAE2CBB7_9LAMI|nr:Vacuolar protein sorting-associated protein 8 [Sesamum alatum]